MARVLRQALSWFVEPLVADTAGPACATRVLETAARGEPFSALQDACFYGIVDAFVSVLAMGVVSYLKMPQILTMLRASIPPPWPCSVGRCVAELFSLLFLLSYHFHAEHPISLYWEQLLLLCHCLVSLFFFAAQNGIMDDEMNTFGGVSVVGCFIWLLFAMDLQGDAMWLLPFLACCCTLLKDAFWIRYGDLPDSEKAGERRWPRYDDDYASHGVYFMVGCLRCWSLLPSSMGVLWVPYDAWAAARYALAALCALILTVEALLARGLSKSHLARSQARRHNANSDK